MEGHTDARTALVEYARQQGGVFTTTNAYACGLTRRMVQGLDRRGEIVRMHRGVYRFAHVAVTPLLMLRAALAAAGETAVASHSSAAMLLGLAEVPIGTPEITVVSRHVPALQRVRVHTSRDLPDGDRTEVLGLACTTGSRTLIDLCPRFDEAVNIHRADQAICASVASRTKLHARANALKQGRRGVWKLAEVTAPGADGTFWSALERAFGENVERHGLPVPEYNAPIEYGGRRYYADALWRFCGLVVELHGLAFHSLPSQRASDDERTNAFARLGLRMLVFRWNQVMYEFDQVAGIIRQAGLTQGKAPLRCLTLQQSGRRRRGARG